MKFPGYPSNREADESAKAFCHRKPLRKREGARKGLSSPLRTFRSPGAANGRCRMKPSRETCLHRENHTPGGGRAIGLTAFFRRTKGGVYLRIGRPAHRIGRRKRKTAAGLVSVPQGGALFFYIKSPSS